MNPEAVIEAAKIVVEAAEKVAETSGKVAEAGSRVVKAEEAVSIGERIDVSKKMIDGFDKGVDIRKRITPEELGKELTSHQKADLKNKGMSPGILDKCKIQDGIIKLKTDNAKLENTKHPESGINYCKKTIDLFGTKLEGVFPEFESKFTTKLPENMYQATDKVQFNECVSQLQEAIKKNPDLKSNFSERQLEQINDGKTPGGFKWHHSENVGEMKLVEAVKHEASGHTGGRAIWGGGSTKR